MRPVWGGAAVLLAAIALVPPAHGGEHDAIQLVADAPGARAIPPGEPQSVALHSGDDLDATIAALPAHSTVQLARGVYAGPVVLDRPIQLRGGRGVEIVGSGRGTVLSIFADDVSVSDVSLHGSGRDTNLGDSGVRVTGSRFRLDDVHIRDVLIGADLRMAKDGVIDGLVVEGDSSGPMGVHGDGLRLWESTNNVIRNSELSHVRDIVVWYSSGNVFENDRVSNSRYGVHFMHSDTNVVRASRFVDDVVGVFAMYSRDLRIESNTITGADGAAGMGFGCKDSDAIAFTDNRVLANTTGVYLDTCPQRIGSNTSVTGNLIAYNNVGLRFHYVRPGLAISDNNLYENHASASVDGNQSALGAGIEGNRWSDYEGYDLDGDGRGDLPYAPAQLSTGLLQNRPVASFFVGTPAASLLDFVGALFPMFLPPPILNDPSPRMGPT
jgi:nitrous oxidase accessory protein